MRDERGFERVGGAVAMVVYFIGFFVTVGLLGAGMLSIYARELEGQSYAERGCPRVEPEFYSCVQERLNHGFLTPGLWWFVAAGAVVIGCITAIVWGLLNASDASLTPGDTERALGS